MQAVRNGEIPTENGALPIVLVAATGTELLILLQRSLETVEYTRDHYIEELYERGWRLRLRGRQIEVLRRGQEEPRADADFGY
jgi:hypothetical protein